MKKTFESLYNKKTKTEWKEHNLFNIRFQKNIKFNILEWKI